MKNRINNKNSTMTVGSHHKNKGLVIIAVLWMVVVLMVMAAILGRKSRLDMKVCLTRMEAVRCKWACRAGIEKAIAVLNEDETENDGLLDLWSNNAEDFNDIMLNQCWFTVRVIDELSKLNINTATKEQLLGLPDMVEEIADAIIDWRDSDDTPSGGGVESGYYEGLTYGYWARNGPFRTIRELLLVKDVTEELFYGEDTNLNGRLDYNERDGQESPPADDGDNMLDVGWAAYLTCYPSGSSGGETVDSNTAPDIVPPEPNLPDRDEPEPKPATGTEQTLAKVNINTASDIVLAALLGGGDEAERTAQAILAYRDTLADGIENISELTEQSVLSSDVFSQIENYITTSSDIFTIRCFATADRNGLKGATLQTEVVVDRSTRPCKILFWYQGTN